MAKPGGRLADLLARGLALHQRGALSQARLAYLQVLKESPRNFDALHLLGVVELQSGQPAAAVEHIRAALASDPRQAPAWSNLAAALRSAGMPAEALESCDKAIALQPSHAQAHVTRGLLLHELGRLDASLASHDEAIRLEPQLAAAHRHRGNTLRALGRLDASLLAQETAVRLAPQDPESYVDRGVTLQALQRGADALADFDKAIALQPGFAPAHNNRGSVLQELRRYAEAEESHRRAVALDPRFADAWNNLGAALRQLMRLDDALAAFEKVIELQPSAAHAWKHQAGILRDLERPHEAMASYERGLAVDPQARGMLGAWLSLRRRMCLWDGFQDGLARLEEGIRRERAVVSPFLCLGFTDDRELQRRAAQIHSRRFAGITRVRPPARVAQGERLRIGYFSADLQLHATAYLIAQVLEAHDRTRFEVVAFSFGPDRSDPMRSRLMRACDRFLEVRDLPDAQVARMSREMGIAVAVDLKGFTYDARPAIFAHGAAPVQVNWLGYPGTMGAPFMDYVIGDAVVTPHDHQQDYTEAIVQLPHSYQSNDATRGISQRRFTRAELGLPEQGFVFCCFNNNYKITPAVFDSWMRILAAVPGSVLWLLEDNADVAPNLRREARARGMDPQRLVFAPRMPLDEHLARHRAADLFLDTLPYNAHTTASDALWAGLPLVTRIGESFAARVAASLLTALGLTQLITTRQEDYESLAVALAKDPARLSQLRASLAAARETSALFDGARFARSMESACLAMVERHAAGLPPGPIVVPDTA